MTQEVTTPRGFKCPITQETFQEPILEADGHTYEKAALDRWDAHSKGRSPMTGLPLGGLPRVPNNTLARALNEFRANRHAAAGQRDEWKRHTESVISYEPFQLPVRLADGHDYEYHEAVEVMQRVGRSVFTQQPFVDGDVGRANRVLQTLSAEIHGFTSRAYPTEYMSVMQLLPSMPAEIGAVDEYIKDQVADYLFNTAREVPMEGARAREVLIYSGRQTIAHYAAHLKEIADVISQRERSLYHLFEGTPIFNYTLPKRTQAQVTRARDSLDAIHASLDVLALNGAAPDPVTERFVRAAELFLQPREELLRKASVASLRATITGVSALLTVWTIAGSGSLAQLAQHGCALGFYLGDRMVAVTATPRPASLHAAAEDVLLARTNASNAFLASFIGAIEGLVSLTMRTASAGVTGAGIGTALGYVVPVGVLTSNASRHYEQLAIGGALTMSTVVMAANAVSLVRATLGRAR